MILALITLFGRQYELVLRPKDPEHFTNTTGIVVEEAPTRPGLRKTLPPSNVYALPSARKAG